MVLENNGYKMVRLCDARENSSFDLVPSIGLLEGWILLGLIEFKPILNHRVRQQQLKPSGRFSVSACLDRREKNGAQA